MRTCQQLLGLLFVASVSLAAQTLASRYERAFTELGAGKPSLQVYDGESHETFLGCLTCDGIVPKSLWNQFGAGNPFSPDSLFNPFSPSRNPFSPYSVCNQFGTHAPVIVDPTGRFYGYLSINHLHPKRTTIALALQFAKDLCDGKLD